VIKTPHFSVVAAICYFLFTAEAAVACPFCPAVSQTLAEEIEAGDAAVIAQYGGDAGETTSDGIVLTEFQIVDVLKDSPRLKDVSSVKAIYFNKPKEGKKFYMLATDAGELLWGTPIPLTDAAETYLKELNSVPEEGAGRLAHFMKFLDHEDPMLAKDAYDEFARAPYDWLIELAPQIDRQQLRTWIADPEVTATRRRLFFTLLGVCGTEEDGEFLAEILRDPKERSRGLDALAGSYLTITGEKGLPLLEDLFLRDTECDFSDTYAVIVAIRFHLVEADRIDDERLLAAMRIMLDRPELADVVIADLARWEDWSAIDRLFELFKTADKESTYIRIPIVRYMNACPLPEAKAYLTEMKKIDESSVTRALATYGSSPTESDESDESEAEASETPTDQTAEESSEKSSGKDEESQSVADTGNADASRTPTVGTDDAAANIFGSFRLLGIILATVILAGIALILVRVFASQTNSKDTA
jgi:hypothetical protein